MEQPLYVRRAVFTVAGKTFAAGDILPWRELGIPFKRLHLLWSTGRLGHEKPDERTGVTAPNALVKRPVEQLPASKPRKQRAAQRATE